MSPIPLDIRECWFGPIRRLQSVSKRSQGLSIIEVKFLVNAEGVPIHWTEPKVTVLEPFDRAKAVIELLTE